MNKNIEIIHIRGHKCLKVICTCHTDEGAMDFGFNYGDDTAFETMKVGNRKFDTVVEKYFGDAEIRTVPSVVSCVKDEEWGWKHMPGMMEDRPDCCYKVVVEKLVIPMGLYKELIEPFGGFGRAWNTDNNLKTWGEFNKCFKEAFGHELTHLPNMGLVEQYHKEWAKEHATK